MRTQFGFLFTRRAAIFAIAVAAAYVCGCWAVGCFPAAIVAAGVICLFFACRRSAAGIRPYIRVILVFVGLGLIWFGAVDKIESVYMCRGCPVVRVTASYRLMGVTLHEGYREAKPGSPAFAARGDKFVLVVRFSLHRPVMVPIHPRLAAAGD